MLFEAPADAVKLGDRLRQTDLPLPETCPPTAGQTPSETCHSRRGHCPGAGLLGGVDIRRSEDGEVTVRLFPHQVPNALDGDVGSHQHLAPAGLQRDRLEHDAVLFDHLPGARFKLEEVPQAALPS